MSDKKTEILEWFERNKKTVLIAGVSVIVLIVAVIVIVCVVNGKKKNGGDVSATPTPVIIPTAAVTNIPTDVPKQNTPTPTATPTNAPAATPTSTPAANATPTPQATATPTAAPTATPTPEPVETGKITYEEAKQILYRYSKETLGLKKDAREYDIDPVQTTALINGSDCYCFTLLEKDSEGKLRNRGEYYISDDGTACYVFDSESGSFVPLPLG